MARIGYLINMPIFVTNLYNIKYLRLIAAAFLRCCRATPSILWYFQFHKVSAR